MGLPVKYPLVVGNGPSRAGYDLRLRSRQFDPVFGCNALHRDFAPEFDLPNYLVCIDDEATAEAVENWFPVDRLISPAPKHNYGVSPVAAWEPPWAWPDSAGARPRNNAGMLALEIAALNSSDIVYFMGFDFLLDRQESVEGNMYDGTRGYGKDTRCSLNDAVIGRRSYMAKMLAQYPNHKFIGLFPRFFLDYARPGLGPNLDFQVSDDHFTQLVTKSQP